jgi:BioD-like phosphotransacetylase family protein
MLLSRLAFSTNTQPTEIVVINGDTLALAPIERIKSSNLLFVKSDSIKAVNYFLVVEIAIKDSIISNYKAIDVANQLQISNLNEMVIEMESNRAEQEKRYKKQKFYRNIERGVFILTIFVLVVVS